MNEYYLSSTENRSLEYVRKCTVVKTIPFESGKNAVIATVDSGVQWKDESGFRSSDTIILTARYEGSDIGDITAFPFLCMLRY